MSEWIERQYFSYGDRNSISGSKLPDLTNVTNAEGSLSPPIITFTDYLLRDENGEIITDQSNNDISLEGTIYA